MNTHSKKSYLFKILLSSNKAIIISCFLILHLQIAFSQIDSASGLPYSTIHLVRTAKMMGASTPAFITFKNQKPFELRSGCVVNYKIYSEGVISVQCEYYGSAFQSGLMVRQFTISTGNEYYVYLNGNIFSEWPREDLKQYFERTARITTQEENLQTPINNSIKEAQGQGSCF